MNAAAPAPVRGEGGEHGVLHLLQLASDYLGKRGVPSARREADALLAHVLGCDRLHLYLRFEEQPSRLDVDRFRSLMVRRGAREPLQYLTGRTRFLELDLACDRRALIPRPETEDLARLVADLPGALDGGACADVGTGSGCLALFLASRGARVLASDCSAEALALAAENASALGLADRIRFVLGHLFEPFGAERFGLIVSNPPYLAEGERDALQPEVGCWEPEVALYAGETGLDVLSPLLEAAPQGLAPQGWLALECGKGQSEILRGKALASERWRSVRTRADSFGVERFLVCQVH